MAKLSKQQRRDLESMLADMQAAWAYLMSDAVAICRPGKINCQVKQTGDEYRQAAPFDTTHHNGRDGAAWSIEWIRTMQPVAKDTGSMLVRLPAAIRRAQQMLEAPANG